MHDTRAKYFSRGRQIAFCGKEEYKEGINNLDKSVPDYNRINFALIIYYKDQNCTLQKMNYLKSNLSSKYSTKSGKS